MNRASSSMQRGVRFSYSTPYSRWHFSCSIVSYAISGFAVAIPGLRKADVDRSIFTRDVKKAQGLLKLCLYEHQTLYPELANATKSVVLLLLP